MLISIFIFTVAGVCRSHLRVTAARKLNRGGNRERWGSGQEEKAVRKTACIQPEIAETASDFVANCILDLPTECRPVSKC